MPGTTDIARLPNYTLWAMYIPFVKKAARIQPLAKTVFNFGRFSMKLTAEIWRKLIYFEECLIVGFS